MDITSDIFIITYVLIYIMLYINIYNYYIVIIVNKLIIAFLFALQYISLATKIFQFMNKHLIGSRSSYVREYVVNGLVEQQMVILAAIIGDLNHETARTETGKFI